MTLPAPSAPAAAESAKQALGPAGVVAHLNLDRRHAAVLIADVAGYSRLMELDETGTHLRLQALRIDVIEPALARHGGRITRSTGDGLLVTFSEATEALCCALDVQRELARRNAGIAADRQIRFRMGLNVGDVLFDRYDIAGICVNLAARLEALARPGEICISRALLDRIPASLAACCLDAGHRRVKNLRDPVRVYRVLARPLTPAILLREWAATTFVELRRWIVAGSSAAVLATAAVTLSSNPATARQEATQAAGAQPARAATVVPAVHAGLRETSPRKRPVT
jgi:class 3 adenylate cyclase